MDFSKKLQDEVDKYNQMIEEEQKLEGQLTKHKERRVEQYGKVLAIDELFKEQLKAASVAASSNGHGKTEQIENVEDLVEEDAAQ